MPLTLGNECSGIVEQTGSKVREFQKGDRVYTRLPINKIGAFAEYVAVDQKEIAKMPKGYDFATAAAIPLTGLTAYQAITEELEATPGQKSSFSPRELTGISTTKPKTIGKYCPVWTM